VLECYIQTLAGSYWKAVPGTVNRFVNVQYCSCVVNVADLQCLQCFDAVGWAAGRASSL